MGTLSTTREWDELGSFWSLSSFRGCWAPILAYIEQQFDAYLEGETRVQRVEVGNIIIICTVRVIIIFTMITIPQVPDTLVHACLYFIAPTGHGLKPLDIDFMRRIHNKVKLHSELG